MTTTSVPHERVARATPSLWLSALVAIVAAAAAAALVAAVARAADVPLTIDGEEIPVAGFAMMTVMVSAVGVLLAAALGRWAPRPRATFTWIAVALTLASFVPSLTADTDTATKVVLVTTHVVAAAIVIPALARAARPPRRIVRRRARLVQVGVGRGVRLRSAAFSTDHPPASSATIGAASRRYCS